MFIDQALAPVKIPADVKLELLPHQQDLLHQIRDVILEVGVPEGEGPSWIADRFGRHADGEIMIFVARVGRLLAGFMILEPASLTASYSWVVERFRKKGLGQRFYSFACINLGAPSPRFVYPAAMGEEYKSVLKALEIKPLVGAVFCTANA